MEKGQKVALLAIGVNLVLFGMKYLFAMLSGSMALTAEAFHSLSDDIDRPSRQRIKEVLKEKVNVLYVVDHMEKTRELFKKGEL